jgi:tripartite-type tricarboxylate transporter receptor subunit TctC
LGQTVVVENKGGANGVPASEFVARSAPDGHTILVTTVPAHAGNRWAYKKLPYDTLADFIPVTVLPQQPLILVAHPSVAANNVADLIKLAKQRPGKINYASFGVGGLSHLAGVQLNLLAGTQMNHVPYKGGGPALADLMGGHVELYFSGLATTLPLIADGKIKPIAMASATRVRSLPNVPAVAETPGFGNFEAAVTPLLLVPAKTPNAVVIKIQLAVDRAMRTEKHLALIAKSGEGDVVTTTPEQSMVMLRKELDRLAVLFKAAGIEPE